MSFVLSILAVGGLVAVLGASILAGMIVFGTSDPPPPLASIAEPFRTVDFRDLPPIETTPARRGTPIAFRVYRPNATAGAADRVLLAIHGSSASGTSLHPLAKAIRAEGWTVYVPDIRGHGATGRRGDIDDARQLDDDLADLLAVIRARHANAPIVLLGFSSGGGFALHVAASPLGREFARVVLISPMLGYDAPTARPVPSPWAKPYLPRIIALSILGKLGIHAFDGLPVIAFAVAPKDKAILTASYSYRLLLAFGTRDYAADLRDARAPIAVLVGSADELFIAERFPETVKAARPDATVTIVPGLGHIAMTTDPRAVPAILAAIRGSG